ncbi:hypothetical protein MRX96_042406 [Rhipicephalus microplus]
MKVRDNSCTWTEEPVRGERMQRRERAGQKRAAFLRDRTVRRKARPCRNIAQKLRQKPHLARQPTPFLLVPLWWSQERDGNGGSRAFLERRTSA